GAYCSPVESHLTPAKYPVCVTQPRDVRPPVAASFSEKHRKIMENPSQAGSYKKEGAHEGRPGCTNGYNRLN
ncbi:hypothetical protein SB912_33375, partial [Pantoea sp. SIMBA_072]